MLPATAMAKDEIPPEAAWTIVLENIGLVHRIVKEHCFNHSDRDDLVQEGILGLMEAARRFDPARQVAFSTYAYPWIRNRVLGYFQARKEIQAVEPSPNGSPSAGEPWDLTDPERDYIRQDLQKHLAEHLISDLDEIERLVVTLYWLSPEPMTMMEIAEALGYSSHKDALIIINRALGKLRQGLTRRRSR